MEKEKESRILKSKRKDRGKEEVFPKSKLLGALWAT